MSAYRPSQRQGLDQGYDASFSAVLAESDMLQRKFEACAIYIRQNGDGGDSGKSQAFSVVRRVLLAQIFAVAIAFMPGQYLCMLLELSLKMLEPGRLHPSHSPAVWDIGWCL